MKIFWKKLIRKPFKGGIAYEWQVGKFIFLFLYPHSNFQPERKNWQFKIGIDKYWKKH